MRERTPLPGSLINRLPKLRMLGMTGARNASLDTPACTARGVVVCSTAGGGNSEAATAELALGLLIAAARAIPAGDANIRAGKFQDGVPVGYALQGKTMGLIGLGRLGSHMARYCKALNMNLLAWSQNMTPDQRAGGGGDDGIQGGTAVALRRGQHPPGAVRSHARPDRCGRPRTDEAGCDPGEHVARADRGREALIEAVQARRIVAALDVFDREPLPANHPLRSAPNVVMTPHLGYGVKETWVGFYPQSVENALAFLDGKPVRVTNPEALAKS